MFRLVLSLISLFNLQGTCSVVEQFITILRFVRKVKRNKLFFSFRLIAQLLFLFYCRIVAIFQSANNIFLIHLLGGRQWSLGEFYGCWYTRKWSWSAGRNGCSAVFYSLRQARHRRYCKAGRSLHRSIGHLLVGLWFVRVFGLFGGNIPSFRITRNNLSGWRV